MSFKLQIREINESDASAISGLSGQLGYNIETSVVREQIFAINRHDDHFAYVAVKQKEVVGFIHGNRALRLTSEPFLEILGLIIDDQSRRQGIARKLVEHFIQNSVPADIVKVRCQVKRKEAHIFYNSLGFVEQKEQKVLERLR